jgi:hypothetical protein
MKNETITIEQQEGMGLRRPSQKFVPAGPLARRPVPAMPGAVSTQIDVTPTATTHIDVRTSEVDRAKGFLLRSVPLYGAFALLVLLVTVFFSGVPFLSLSALTIFWLSFVAAWLLAYCYDLSRSPSGIAHMEATRKWNLIEREHDRRWQHYERLTEQEGE